MAEDQRLDDGGSLVFDTGPLSETLEILGAPILELALAADRPQALVAARLSDVAPGGAATLVSYGLLNLSHRDSHEHPAPLEPGRRYSVRVQLNDCGRVFPKGHRLRIALSTSYWPIAWPSPEAALLTVYSGISSLTLPVRPPSAEDSQLPALPPVELAAPLATTTITPGKVAQTIARDRATGLTTVTREDDRGRIRFDDIDLMVGWRKLETFTIGPTDPSSARHEAVWNLEFARDGWQVRTETRTVMWATRRSFEIEATLDAFESSARAFSKSWKLSIPRDHV